MGWSGLSEFGKNTLQLLAEHSQMGRKLLVLVTELDFYSNNNHRIAHLTIIQLQLYLQKFLYIWIQLQNTM